MNGSNQPTEDAEMLTFKTWCRKQLNELAVLESIYVELDDPGETVEWIVQQAADRAARLGLAGLYHKSIGLRQTNLEAAKWYLSECLAAVAATVQASKPKSDLLTVRQAAAQLNVSQRTIYDLVESGRLKCQRIGIGRGTIRIRSRDLDGCLAEPAKTIYKHLTI
jgi:excisionase family DNA binding protein